MKRMLSLIFILCLLALSGVGARCETVSQKEAKRIATLFFDSAYGQKMAPPRLVYNGRRLTTGSYFAPFYVYNHPAGGFVVIAADNKAFPVLGYSLSDTFSPDDIGPGLRALLTLYARHIENIRYDSTVPLNAIEAWQDLPSYLHTMLEARYSATDPVTTPDEALTALTRTTSAPDAAASASLTYSPEQWQQLIDTELDLRADVPLGISDGDDSLFPAIVYGRKWDMYRILLDNRDKALWRLLPTETLSAGEIALLGNPPALPDTVEEEQPFTFYEDFVRTVAQEEQKRRAAIEGVEPMVGDAPRVVWHGSGHFTVTLPEKVLAMRVYGIDGQLVQRDAFRDTNVANVSLTQNPTGFYFAVFFGESGQPYAVKLFR